MAIGPELRNQTKTRARSRDAKLARRELILRAAGRVVDRHGFQFFTVDRLSTECGLAKTSIYVYFTTREEVLLSLLQEDFAVWFAGMKQYLAVAEQPFGPHFADVWIGGVSSLPRLAQGMTFVHAFLEPNVSPAYALEWKRFLFAQTKELHYTLLCRFPGSVPFEGFAQFLVGLTGITAGFWNHSSSNDVIRGVYEAHPELAIFHTDFATHMRISIQALLACPPYAPIAALRSPPA